MTRVKPNRKKYKRRISISLALAMIICLAIITSVSISAFEWMRDLCLSHAYIKGITVKGNNRVSSTDILHASNLRVGTDSACSIVSHVLEKRIVSRLRYLEQVKIQHKFALKLSEGMYGWVTIKVREREPVARVGIGGSDGSFAVIDTHGFILEVINNQRQVNNIRHSSSAVGRSLPVIIGVDGRTLESGVQNESPALDLALDVLIDARSVIPELSDEISCIDAQNPDDIIIQLKAHNALPAARNSSVSQVAIRVASGRIKEGLSDVVPVIMKRREEERETGYIDARFPGAIYCSGETYSERGWKSG